MKGIGYLINPFRKGFQVIKKIHEGGQLLRGDCQNLALFNVNRFYLSNSKKSTQRNYSRALEVTALKEKCQRI